MFEEPKSRRSARLSSAVTGRPGKPSPTNQLNIPGRGSFAATEVYGDLVQARQIEDHKRIVSGRNSTWTPHAEGMTKLNPHAQHAKGNDFEPFAAPSLSADPR